MTRNRAFINWLRFLLEGIAIGLILSLGLSLHEANRQLIRAMEALNEARVIAHEVNRRLVDILNQGPSYPQADVLYVDEAPKNTVITFIDGQNALILMRQDGVRDTLYYGGNQVPTVILKDSDDIIAPSFKRSDVWGFRGNESMRRPEELIGEEAP